MELKQRTNRPTFRNWSQCSWGIRNCGIGIPGFLHGQFIQRVCRTRQILQEWIQWISWHLGHIQQKSLISADVSLEISDVLIKLARAANRQSLLSVLFNCSHGKLNNYMHISSCLALYRNTFSLFFVPWFKLMFIDFLTLFVQVCIIFQYSCHCFSTDRLQLRRATRFIHMK